MMASMLMGDIDNLQTLRICGPWTHLNDSLHVNGRYTLKAFRSLKICRPWTALRSTRISGPWPPGNDGLHADESHRQPPEAVPWVQLTYGQHNGDKDRFKIWLRFEKLLGPRLIWSA
jgi:hypothetical protein